VVLDLSTDGPVGVFGDNNELITFDSVKEDCMKRYSLQSKPTSTINIDLVDEESPNYSARRLKRTKVTEAPE
jgi:hypothetical protein